MTRAHEANPSGINGSSPDPGAIRANRRRSIQDWRGVYVVYRLYAKGELMYIGTSKCWPLRMHQHRVKPWFSTIDRIVIKVYPSNLAAYAAERIAIRAEEPQLNAAHNTRVSARRAAA